MPDGACRIDVWLWRARFFKTRALAAVAVESGRIRITRLDGSQARLDKASRAIRPGESLVFAHAGRLHMVRIAALGERRGPATEARLLYEPLPTPEDEPLTNRPRA